MARRRSSFFEIDTKLWSTVDFQAVSPEKRKVLVARCEAIDLYVAGTALRDIEAQTGVSSRQLYWLLDRCMKEAEDGRIYGYRALLKSYRTGSYTRTAQLSKDFVGTRQGYAGAFALLLERYPGLAAWLKIKIEQRAVAITQISTDGRLKSRLRNLCHLHAAFIIQCRKAGITGADYPLNTERMESFTRAVEIMLKESELQDRADFRPSVEMWRYAVRNSGYVQARVATARIMRELSNLS